MKKIFQLTLNVLTAVFRRIASNMSWNAVSSIGILLTGIATIFIAYKANDAIESSKLYSSFTDSTASYAYLKENFPVFETITNVSSDKNEKKYWKTELKFSIENMTDNYISGAETSYGLCKCVNNELVSVYFRPLVPKIDKKNSKDEYLDFLNYIRKLSVDNTDDAYNMFRMRCSGVPKIIPLDVNISDIYLNQINPKKIIRDTVFIKHPYLADEGEEYAMFVHMRYGLSFVQYKERKKLLGEFKTRESNISYVFPITPEGKMITSVQAERFCR